MVLEERILRLIAIGASIPASCEVCLQVNAAKARECGASDVEIAEAMWVGKMVRRGTASRMDRAAATVNRRVPSVKDIPSDTCECA